MSMLNENNKPFFSSKGASRYVLSIHEERQNVTSLNGTPPGEHTADVSSDWDEQPSAVTNRRDSLEVTWVCPSSTTWERCLLFEPDLPTHIYIENRFREGEIDNIIPDTLSVGWTAIYLVSDQTYQLWAKFHNCRRLCVATSTKKCGIVHYGLTDLCASNMSCRLRELCYRIFVVVAVELKRCSSSLWSLRLVVNSLKSALFPFILAC